MVTSTPFRPSQPGPLSLPVALTGSLRLNPEQFAQLCRANPDAVLELAADGSLITMTPTGSETGGRNGALLVELGLALRSGGLPYKLFDSSTGFRLPDGSVRMRLVGATRLEGGEAFPELAIELAEIWAG